MEANQSPQLLAEDGDGETPQIGQQQAGGGVEKPKSAYKLFFEACREEHRKTHPDDNSKITKLAKMWSLKWREMSEEEKMHFVELAEKDKKRYEEELEEEMEEEMANLKKGEERTENPNPPQRAVSAFLWFYSDERLKVKTAMPDGTSAEIANEVRRRWNECSQDVRNKYVALAAEDNARYERELEAYKEKFGVDEEGSDVAEAAGFDRGARPPLRIAAYAFFVQTCRDEHNKENPNKPVVYAEFAKKCADRWKAMSDQEKQRFQQLAEKDKRRDNEKERNAKRIRTEMRKSLPNRALSDFFWFCVDERPKIQAEMPNATALDVSKEVGRRWNERSQEVKDKYGALAAKDRARYERELAAHREKYGVEEEGDDDLE